MSSNNIISTSTSRDVDTGQSNSIIIDANDNDEEHNNMMLVTELDHHDSHSIISTSSTVNVNPSNSNSSNNGGHNSGPQQHLYRRWSCEPCRNRKIKCDGVRPRCGYCSKKASRKCVFLGSKVRVSSSSSTSTSASASISSAASSSSPSSNIIVVSTPSLVPSLEDNTGNHDGFDSNKKSAVTKAGDEESQRAVDALVEKVESSFHGLLAGIYSEKPSEVDNMESVNPFLLNVVCAVGAITSVRPKEVVLEYYERGRRMVQESLENPGLENLQAILLISSISSYLSKKSVAWMFLGMACRMGLVASRGKILTGNALFLRLNNDPDSPLAISQFVQDGDGEMEPVRSSWVDKETRRRLWWACYMTDKLYSVIANRPSCLDKTNHDVQPMCSDELWESLKDPALLESQYRFPRAVSSISPSQPLIRLTDLFARIVRFVNYDPVHRLEKGESVLFHTGKPLSKDVVLSPAMVNNVLSPAITSTTTTTTTSPISSSSALIDQSQSEYEYIQLRSELIDFLHTGIPPHLRLVASKDWFLEVMNDPVSGPPWGLFMLHFMYHANVCLLNRPMMLRYLQEVVREKRNSQRGGTGNTGGSDDRLTMTTSTSMSGNQYQYQSQHHRFYETYQRNYNAYLDAKSSAEAIGILVQGITSANPSAVAMSGMLCAFAFQGALVLVLLLHDVTRIRIDFEYEVRVRGWLDALLQMYESSSRVFWVAKAFSNSLRATVMSWGGPGSASGNGNAAAGEKSGGESFGREDVVVEKGGQRASGSLVDGEKGKDWVNALASIDVDNLMAYLKKDSNSNVDINSHVRENWPVNPSGMSANGCSGGRAGLTQAYTNGQDTLSRETTATSSHSTPSMTMHDGFSQSARTGTSVASGSASVASGNGNSVSPASTNHLDTDHLNDLGHHSTDSSSANLDSFIAALGKDVVGSAGAAAHAEYLRSQLFSHSVLSEMMSGDGRIGGDAGVGVGGSGGQVFGGMGTASSGQFADLFALDMIAPSLADASVDIEMDWLLDFDSGSMDVPMVSSTVNNSTE
ncbi:hypothetical protein HDU76_012264 [Blyttiomyces sp. JEL0837]|nr:hypothetical protein HDU76_012264 [Blyttiomyces sp. JEL0837]